MQELAARIAQAAGIDASTAEKAIATILAFLKEEVPASTMNKLMAVIPGAEEALASAGGGGIAGALGGLFGGGVAALGAQLMGLGLDMGQMQVIGHELFAFAAEHAGPEVVGEVAQAVPQLSAFL